MSPVVGSALAVGPAVAKLLKYLGGIEQLWRLSELGLGQVLHLLGRQRTYGGGLLSHIIRTMETRHSMTENIEKIMKASKGSIASSKLMLCRRFSSQDTISLCYRENTPKEELVLEHVLDYEKQFSLTYRMNRPLLLYPRNECGTPKFICTTLRPTQMPFLELYDWNRCASFIADFFEYEELDPPNEFPKVIPSPSNTLRWQHGDSFDLAIVLASLLIAAGYDAYCVHGRAPREICSRDQSTMLSPFLDREQDSVSADFHLQAPREDEEFVIERRLPLISQFEKNKEEEKIREEKRQWELDHTIDDDTPEVKPPDPWKGERLHCWVLVKEGKREVEAPFFIEPTTGRRYTLDSSLYENVEFVFNHTNFWIHMMPSKAVNEVDFDLYAGDWEYVMLPTEQKKEEHENNEEEIEEKEEKLIILDERDADGDFIEIEHVLDMPPPWCPKLHIDRDAFAKRCPSGERTTFYERWKVDQYAEYTECDGLVQRFTIFKDYRRQEVKEVRSFFAHRVDKLMMRRRFPYEFKTVEDYAPGRIPMHWRQIVEVDGESRIILFYPNRNTDGMIKREERIGRKTMEYYQNRDDFLVYRSWTFVKPANTPTARDYQLTDNHVGNVVLTKITEKYERNPNLPYGRKPAMTVYDFSKKDKVTIYYHYEPGSIRRNVVEYQRDRFQALKMGEDREREAPTDSEHQELEYIMEKEKNCHSDIKKQESTANEEIEIRTNVETRIATFKASDDINAALKESIRKTVYDRAREKNKEVAKEKEEEQVQERPFVDYLTPVLRDLKKEGRELTPAEAQQVKDEVMRRLKTRLLHRANIIQESLERERKALQEKQTEFERKGQHVTPDEQREFDEFFDQTKFKIDILEQRAARHEDMALEKYAEMDAKLMQEPTLAALHNLNPKKT